MTDVDDNVQFGDPLRSLLGTHLPDEIVLMIYADLFELGGQPLEVSMNDSLKIECSWTNTLDAFQAVSKSLYAEAWNFVCHDFKCQDISLKLVTNNTFPSFLLRLLKGKVPKRIFQNVQCLIITHLSMNSITPLMQMQNLDGPNDSQVESPYGRSIWETVNYDRSAYSLALKRELSLSILGLRFTLPSLRMLEIGLDVVECMPLNSSRLRGQPYTGSGSGSILDDALTNLTTLREIEQTTIKVHWVEALESVPGIGMRSDWVNVSHRVKEDFLDILRAAVPAKSISGHELVEH